MNTHTRTQTFNGGDKNHLQLYTHISKMKILQSNTTKSVKLQVRDVGNPIDHCNFNLISTSRCYRNPFYPYEIKKQLAYMPVVIQATNVKTL